jgi:CHAT domain
MRGALLAYFTSDDGIVVVVLTPGAPAPLVTRPSLEPLGHPLTARQVSDRVTRLLVDVHGLPPDWDHELEIEKYTRVLSLPPAVNAAKRLGPVLQRKLHNPAFSYGTDYLEQIGTALVPGLVRPLLADCDVLCIVPHGPLHSIPFAVLPWDSGRRLGERFGLCQVPSASLLPLLQGRNAARKPGPVRDVRARTCLAAAVAAADDADPDEMEADAALLTTLLEQAGGSAVSLVGATGPAAATRGAVMAGAPGHDIVHLACHGVFAESLEDPMDASGLLLSDGQARPVLGPYLGGGQQPDRSDRHLLSARDVLGLSLRAELVTLRACSSGRTAQATGDELLGLIRAFLHAGTPSLLASLWNVNKSSSRQLLEHFYRAWLADAAVPKWRALQTAQQELRQIPEYDHPFHWAPFVLVGDWL